ncbi:hypothetical protein ACNOYE_36430 [Nannocystaceae bacterium ST9]
MSAQRKIRRQILQSFRSNPRPLIDTLVVANDVPEIDPASIRPYPFCDVDPIAATTNGPPPLAWQVDLVKPVGVHFIALVDVVSHLDPERVWMWLLWRTLARANSGCPAWMMVCPTNDAVLAAIRRAFDHEPANLPMLITPDAKVVALPRRPAPRPPTPLFV